MCINKADAPTEFCNLMDFLTQCKLAYSVLEAPILHCEVIEELWVTTFHDSEYNSIAFTLKSDNYTLTTDILSVCLSLAENNQHDSLTKQQIRTMLREINYAQPDANLGKIVREGCRKEWIYFYDSIIKVFYGKISNFDVVTTVMQELAYAILYNHFHYKNALIFNKIGCKLGMKESRSNSIYYYRFIMLVANHVAPILMISKPKENLTCWVLNKRLFKDLANINLHEGAELRFPQVIQVFLNSFHSSNTLNSLTSSAAMEGLNIPNLHTQASKPKKSKTKYKATSIVSQKTIVEKSTESQTEGSDQVVRIVEKTGGNQKTQKNKKGEAERTHPNHPESS